MKELNKNLKDPMPYKGSGPAPKYKQGEMIPGKGVVHSRSQTNLGTWVYGCYNERCSQIIYHWE